VKHKLQTINNGRRGLLLGGISAAVSLPILSTLTSTTKTNKVPSLSYRHFYETWAATHNETPSKYISEVQLLHSHTSASGIVKLEFAKGNTTNIEGLIISRYEHATLAVLGQA
jgi:hypothetical protein